MDKKLKRADSVYETISFTGVWCIAAEPAKKLYGYLSGSIAEGFFLKIPGELGNMETTVTAFVIHGETSDGEKLTLIDCLPTSRTGALPGFGGAHESTYSSSHVLVGDHFPSADAVRFRRIQFGLPLLEEWHGLNCFNPIPLVQSLNSDGHTSTPIYQRPVETVLCTLAGMSVSLFYATKILGNKNPQTELTIEHAARISIVSDDGEQSFFDLGKGPTKSFSAVAGDLCRFFTFCTKNSIYMFDIHAETNKEMDSDPEAAPRKSIRIYSSRNIPQHTHKTRPWEMDLPAYRLGENGQKHIEAWFTEVSGMRSALSFYLDVSRGEVQYLETQVADLCQALEGFHRSAISKDSEPSAEHKNKVQLILSSAPSDFCGWLKEKLKYSHQLTLRNRLKDVLDRYQTTVQWLVGDNSQQKKFVGWAVDTRNAYAHASDSGQGNTSGHSVANNYWRMQYLRCLMFMCVLSKMGLSGDEVHKIAKQNKVFRAAVTARTRPRDPKKIHVEKSGERWIVTSQGASMAEGFSSRDAALRRAQNMASETSGEIIEHDVAPNSEEEVD